MRRLVIAAMISAGGLLSACAGDATDPDDTAVDTEVPDDTDADTDIATPPAIGACCTVDAHCRVTRADRCDELDGAHTEGALCSELQCPAPSLDDLQALTEELELVVIEDLEAYVHTVGIVAREYWNLNGAIPSYTGDLLGKDGATLSPGGNRTTTTFVARYRAVRHAQRIIRAAQSTSATLTPEQLRGFLGFARTFQAHALLLALGHQHDHGILPVEALDDPQPMERFLGYVESLDTIADLLDVGATDLTNGGAEFAFVRTTALDGFSTPATFRQVNRALSARVNMYRGDRGRAIGGIAGSFFNINGSMDTGPRHPYSVERPNPMYHEPDEDLFTVHPAFLADASVGDVRVAQKTRPYDASTGLTVPVSHDGLTGDTQVRLVELPSEGFPIIRNEELILIYAEAQIGSDVNESLAAVNRVRNAAGLGNYLGATDDASMRDEVLRQRRYSLFGEGHQWMDLWRFGRLDLVPVDRRGDIVHDAFPRPTEATVRSVLDL